MKSSNKKNNFYTQRQPFASRLLLIVWCLVSSTGSVLAVYPLEQVVSQAILDSFSDAEQKLWERQLRQLLLKITQKFTGESSEVPQTCQDCWSEETAIDPQDPQMLVKLAKVLAEKIPWIQSEKDSRCELAKGYAPYVEKVLRDLEGLEIMYLVEIDLLGWMEQYASVVLRDKQKALEYQKQICDNSYSVLVHNCKKLAIAQGNAGQNEKALASMKEALEIHEKSIAGRGNVEDSNVVHLLQDIAKLYTSMAKQQEADEKTQEANDSHGQALQYTQRALAMRRRLLQKQRGLNLGSLLAPDLHLASLLEEDNLDVAFFSEEEDDSEVADLLIAVGACHKNLEQSAEAECYNGQGQEMRQRLYEKKHELLKVQNNHQL